MTTTNTGAKAPLTLREKPDLSIGGSGIVDPVFIPIKIQNELRKTLTKSGLTEEQKDGLLKRSNGWAQDQEFEFLTAAAQIARLRKIATSAKRLLNDITLMPKKTRDGFHAHASYLTLATDPPIDFPCRITRFLKDPSNLVPEEEFLSMTWDWVDSLRLATEYTARQYKTSNTGKPKDHYARALVSVHADWCKRVTGRLPPKSYESWFALYVVALGKWCKLTIGARIVRSGIEEVERQVV